MNMNSFSWLLLIASGMPAEVRVFVCLVRYHLPIVVDCNDQLILRSSICSLEASLRLVDFITLAVFIFFRFLFPLPFSSISGCSVNHVQHSLRY